MTAIRIALFALCAMLLPAPVHAGNGKPLQLKMNDFPTLATDRYAQRLAIFDSRIEDFPSRCDELRIAQRRELAARWRPSIAKLVFRYCDTRPFEELLGKDYLSYGAQATFKAGAVTLYGLSVIRYEEDMGAMRGSQRYVLNAPIAELLKAMRPLIERDCLPMLELNPMTVSTCTMSYNEASWDLIVGELNHTISLGADPDNPAHSYYQVSGGD